MELKKGGLTEQEYLNLLKECGMCTKKWTLSKKVKFEEKRKELLEKKYCKKSKFNLFKKFRKEK